MKDHLDVIKSLNSTQRKALTRKSDWKGLLYVASYLAIMALLTVYILFKAPLWPIVMWPLGIMIVFLFTLLHETSHKTVFKTARLNIVVGTVCGFLILLPAHWFKLFHFEHHRHTQDPGKDPELVTPKPNTIARLVWHVSGIPVWISHCKVLWRNALGDHDSFVPELAQRSILIEARMYLLIYASIIAASIYFQSAQVLYIWIIPIILGQPLLRLYLLAEHSHCSHSSNVLNNTRTLKTNRLVRFLAWNMPYHIEHHAHPGVPFTVYRTFTS